MRAIIEVAKSKPCADCGIEYPPQIMDLDHVRGTKHFSLGQWAKAKPVPGMSKEDVVRAEIAKCEVRCANCHRMRHWRETELLA